MKDQLHSEIHVQLIGFGKVSEKDIVNTVRKSPTKHCDMDPIPTSFLKDILELIAQLLQEITNKSITFGVFQQDFMEALVNLLLMNIILDYLNKKNYCPVSNLSFGSKLVDGWLQIN